MKRQFSIKDYVLWVFICIYVGIIYGTTSKIALLRKFLVEKYGVQVFDYAYWMLGIFAVCALIYCFRKFKTGELLRKLIIICVFCGYTVYYLSGFEYAIEKVHFVEYGILGILIFTALFRHMKQWIVILFALNIVYWISLGDEVMQHFTKNRVSEIRDALINLFSGGFSVLLLWIITKSSSVSYSEIRIAVKKTLIIFLTISTAASALFLYDIHGFGFVIETKVPGRIYSSFSLEKLQEINAKKSEISKRALSLYENEALRHLFQREFYFTNDFKASNGSFYHDYVRCYYENEVLEYFYSRFMQKHALDSTGVLIMSIDADVARKVLHNPVVWADTVHAFMKAAAANNSSLFSSRVKEILITSFTVHDLLFYSLLLCGLLGYWWIMLINQNRKK